MAPSKRQQRRVSGNAPDSRGKRLTSAEAAVSAAPPFTPRVTRQTVLTGRIARSPSSQPQTPDGANRFAKLLASSRASPSSAHPASSSPAAASTPSKPGTATALSGLSPSARPKGGKYGPCPRCGTGRRVRSRFKPHGTSPHKGKFRFVCSNRGGGESAADGPQQGQNGCDYWEALDTDPLEDPAAFREQAHARLQERTQAGGQAQGQAQGRGKGPHPAGTMVQLRLEDMMTTGSPSAPSTPSRKSAARRAGTPPRQQRLGCPICRGGWLVKRCKEMPGWRETALVCERDECGYEIPLDSEPRDAGAGEDIIGGIIIQRKEDEEEEEAADRSRARPRPAAVTAEQQAEELKNRVLVDLTEEDDEDDVPAYSSTTLLPATPVAIGGAVGGCPVIVIPDDEPEASEFDELGSEDEVELIKLADCAAVEGHDADNDDNENDDDDLDEEEEAELIRLADQASSDLNEEDEMQLIQLADQVGDELNEEDERELIELADRVSSSMSQQ